MRKKIIFLIMGLIIFIVILILNLRLTKEITDISPEISEPEEILPELEREIPPIIREEGKKVEKPLPPEESIPEIEIIPEIEKKIQQEKEEETEPLQTQPLPEELKELKQKGVVIY